MNDEEIDQYWERYAALSTREQIRQDGLSSWLCNTNKGIAVALTVQILAVLLIAKLLGV